MNKRSLKFLGIFLFFGLIFTLPLFPQETLTITTYFPAPMGSYSDLRAMRMAVGPTAYDPAIFCWSNNPVDCTHLVDNNNPHTTSLLVENEMRVVTYNENFNPGIYLENRNSSVQTYLGIGAGDHGPAPGPFPSPYIELRGMTAHNAFSYIDFSCSANPQENPAPATGSRDDYDVRVSYRETNNFNIEAPAMYLYMNRDTSIALRNRLRFRIATNGNVGIGISPPVPTPPATRFYVYRLYGDADATHDIYSARFDGNNTYGVGIGGYRWMYCVMPLPCFSTDADYGVIQGLSPTTKAPLVMNPNGQAVGVGIGVGVTPRATFHINSPAAVGWLNIAGVASNSMYSALYLHNSTPDTNNNWIITQRSGSPNYHLAFRRQNAAGTLSTNLAFYPAAGVSTANVGIGGTASPTANVKLHLNGGYLHGEFNRTTYDTTVASGAANVTCPAGTWVISGGGWCLASGPGFPGSLESIVDSCPYPLTSGSTPTGWHVYCRRTDILADAPAYAYVICGNK